MAFNSSIGFRTYRSYRSYRSYKSYSPQAIDSFHLPHKLRDQTMKMMRPLFPCRRVPPMRIKPRADSPLDAFDNRLILELDAMEIRTGAAPEFRLIRNVRQKFNHRTGRRNGANDIHRNSPWIEVEH